MTAPADQHPVNLPYLAAQIGGLGVVFGAILFLSAGTLAWIPGWVFVVLFFVFVIALTLWLLGHSPALLRERMRGFTPDQKAWDKALLGLAGRHPMYAAFVLFVIATTLLLGSWYGLVGGLLLVLVVARRAVLEERALRDGLAG